MPKKKKSPDRFKKLRARMQRGANFVKVTHVIKLDGKINSEVPPRVSCTCGYLSEPDSNLMNLGLLAKQHEIENPGHYRRHHV